MPTQEELIAMLRSNYDRRNAAEAEIEKLDAEEEAIAAVIEAYGYDGEDLSDKAY
jgi:hypothetical protein